MNKPGKPPAALLQPSKVVCEVWNALTDMCRRMLVSRAFKQTAHADFKTDNVVYSLCRLWEWTHMTGTGHLFFNKPCRQIP